MKANAALNKQEIQLIFEALDHLYFETDRNMQYTHVDHLPKLKEHYLDKKKKLKDLLKIIKNENKL